MLLKLRRKFSALLVALLVFSLFSPGVALADPWYMGLQTVYVNDNASSFDSVVVAPNQYAAAAYVMGAEPQLLTEEQKNILSDGLFCPNFCQYAASFQEFDPMAPPDWLPQYVYASLVASGIGVAALGNKRYVSSASNFLFQDAKEELQAVLSGETPGGDGSGGGSDTPGSIPNTLTFTMADYVGSEDGLIYGYRPGQPLDLSATIDISNYVSDISSQTDAYPYVTFIFWRNGRFSNNSNGTLDVYCSSEAPEIGTRISFSSGVNRQYQTSPVTVNGHNDLTIKKANGNWYTSVGNGWDLNTAATFLITNYSGGTPSDPSGDWPADPEPTSPTPPELPVIDDNPIPTEPTETDISVNLPDIYVTVGGSAADLTDVISILKVINGNLVTINDNLEDEFNSVINAFNAIGGQIEQLAQRIREHCQHIRTSIYQNTTHLENEIYKLFHWLKDELDFGFDDSSIVDYLRRILDKLNNVSYQPNPIADPFNFFDWLMGLLGGFLASLVSGLPGVLQDLLTDLSSLTEYFPFSMPWDVYGLLLLFAHDPVTPVFDLPWNFAANHTAQIHIDLSQYDGIMAIIRAVEKVIFAAGLAVFTMKMFKPTDVLGDE